MTYSLAGQATAVRVTGDPDDTNNGLFYLYSDHLGSASVLQRSDGAVVNQTRYAPFGAYRSGGQNDITDRGFTGHRHNDDLGLIYMNARYYVPRIARFASADTLVPDPTNPQALNRYTYSLNSPLNYIDPTGHRAVMDDSSTCSILTCGLNPDEDNSKIEQYYSYNEISQAKAVWLERHGSNDQWLILRYYREAGYDLREPGSSALVATNRAIADSSYIPSPIYANACLDSNKPCVDLYNFFEPNQLLASGLEIVQYGQEVLGSDPIITDYASNDIPTTLVSSYPINSQQMHIMVTYILEGTSVTDAYFALVKDESWADGGMVQNNWWVYEQKHLYIYKP